MNTSHRNAQEIFAQALDIADVMERRNYLDQACAGDAALRQEVESLLAANSAAGEFLRRPAPVGAGAAPKTKLIPPLSEKSGMRIGRYKLLEQIGEGGFGVVWMAEQEEPVRRRVALKIIKLGMDTREVVARFEAERQALAMMDHPNIASVFDGGATETGRPYFVMELVKGVPLTDYCDANRLSTAQRLDLFVQVCHAVQHAHQKGVIHRDLKPTNILVTVKDDKPVPKVIDFGVAKATQARLTEKTMFTQFRQWIGTPAYMSPEQAGLGSLDVDTRSDVYSLGVLLYELLTGRTPFDTQKLLESGYEAVMRTIREEEPPKPSTRLSTLNREDLSTIAAKRGAEPGKLNRLVLGDLDWIVMKALEKDRTRRYETPAALASDLTRHLNSEPVSATPPSTAYLIGKYVHRNRVAVTFAATVVSVLVVGLCTTLVALKRARQEKSRAEAGAAIATAINDYLQSTMLDSLMEHRVTNRAVSSHEELDALAGNVERQFGGQPQVEAAVRFTLGRTYASLGDYAAAGPQIERAVEIRRKELGESHPATLEALGALGFLRFNQGKPAEAERLLREVLNSQRRALGEGDPATIQTLVMLDAVQTPRGAPTLAPELLKAINSLRDDDPRTLRALHSVVDTLRSEKRLAEAETLGRELLKKRERVLGTNHSETVQALLCLSYTMHELDRLDECEQLRREALRRGRESNPTGAETLTAFKRLIELLTERTNYNEAQRLLEEELEMEQRVLGPESGTTQSTRETLARLTEHGENSRKAAGTQQRPQDIELSALDRAIEGALTHGDYSQALRRLADEIQAEQVQLGPTNEQTLQTVRQLADLSGCVADWAGSVRQMRVLMELPGCDLVVLRGCAVAALLDGDERSYREICARVLSEYGATTDAHEADMAAKVCLLIPDAVADLQRAIRLANVAAAEQPDLAWYRLVKGMAEYRAGHAAEALRWLDEPASDDDPRIASLAGLFSAMARHRLGEGDQARAALSAASRRFDAALSKGNLGEQAGPKWWFDAAAAILIRAEAERLIMGREVSPRPTTDSLAAARRAWWLARQKLGSECPASLVVPAGWKVSFAPDNQHIAFGKIGGGIAVLDYASGRSVDLVPTGKDPAWSPDGRSIAYVTDGSEAYYSEEVWVVSTNGGQSMKVGKGGFPSWSADSTRAYFQSRDRNEILAVRVGESKAQPTVFFPECPAWYPAISPDESRIAFCAREQLIIVDCKTAQTVATLAMPGERDALPAWSPDGKRVAFGGVAGSRSGLWIYDVERRGAFQVARNGGCTMPAWSPDGKRLAFDLRGATNEVWLINTEELPHDPALIQELPSRVAPAPAVREALRSALVGRLVPGNFKLPLLDGGQLLLPDASNTNILLLDFWATWCGPCRQMLPVLADIAKDYAPRGVRYLAVNLREQPEAIRSFLVTARLSPSVALDGDGAMAQAFQVEGIPTMVVVDRQNIVRKVHVGASPEAGAELRRALDEVLGNDAGQGALTPEGKQPGSGQ